MVENKQKIGWIGVGRMGLPMAERMLKAGYDLSIWNRTRSKAEPLAKLGVDVRIAALLDVGERIEADDGRLELSIDGRLQQRIVAKITYKLIPFLSACFMAAFLDRVNVGFAKEQMIADLGLSNAIYGLGYPLFTALGRPLIA